MPFPPRCDLEGCDCSGPLTLVSVCHTTRSMVVQFHQPSTLVVYCSKCDREVASYTVTEAPSA